MDKGIRALLCVLILTIIMIAERGIPIKLRKYDLIEYTVTFLVLLMVSGYF